MKDKTLNPGARTGSGWHFFGQAIEGLPQSILRQDGSHFGYQLAEGRLIFLRYGDLLSWYKFSILSHNQDTERDRKHPGTPC